MTNSLRRRTVIAVGLAMPFVSTCARAELPEIPPIPEKLKGTGEVRIATFGGFMQQTQKKAYFEPFEKLNGVKVTISPDPTLPRSRPWLTPTLLSGTSRRSAAVRF